MSNISPYDSFENSYLTVVESSEAQMYACVFQRLNRDFDVLSEKLGNFKKLIVQNR